MSAYGARRTPRGVNFICVAPQAQSVGLVGDFIERDTSHLAAGGITRL
jgi:1,4-alpha-glucan branching enzyme